MSDSHEKDIDALFADGREIDEAIRRSGEEAVRRHKLLGNPIAVWEDGKVRWLQPDEIPLPEDEKQET